MLIKTSFYANYCHTFPGVLTPVYFVKVCRCRCAGHTPHAPNGSEPMECLAIDQGDTPGECLMSKWKRSCKSMIFSLSPQITVTPEGSHHLETI